MIETLSRTWALLLGMMLLMVGNGIQGTLLGIRGALEEFSTFEMSLIMSAYFLGFLGGSRYAPDLIRRVGHVRVFAALASLISAILILFPSVTIPAVWILLRVVMGFCFSGVYVTAESWLNNAATNENRGMTLSLYLVVQMVGIVTAQGLLTLADPGGFVLFVIPSVLVSIAFAPILLSASPTPPHDQTKPMGIREIFKRAPLSCVGVTLLGGVFSAIFGMASVYGGQAGLSIAQISIYVAVIYLGGLFLQFPVGYLSDRMDRRKLIVIMAGIGALASVVGFVGGSYEVLLAAAFLIGGTANPLYGIVLAYANDHLHVEDMAAASGRLMFLNGCGAIGGPLLTGWIMEGIGPKGFYVFIGALMTTLMIYGVYRTFRRPAPAPDDSGTYVAVGLGSSAVAMSAAQDYYVEQSDDEPSVFDVAPEGEEEPEELPEPLEDHEVTLNPVKS
ncbi:MULTISPECIES: MFS transporter [unclassified Meridianimarinicoccus]|uniref:MFS transporter n=1 Tax=unclassified Meridianimarinicoccus TaxID=2923344 RepID=UPI001865C1D1|nr:MFS transporter [Fluviibacterium sp. MJW13]